MWAALLPNELHDPAHHIDLQPLPPFAPLHLLLMLLLLLLLQLEL
jgi:hypothetical protein